MSPSLSRPAGLDPPIGNRDRGAGVLALLEEALVAVADRADRRSPICSTFLIRYDRIGNALTVIFVYNFGQQGEYILTDCDRVIPIWWRREYYCGNPSKYDGSSRGLSTLPTDRILASTAISPALEHVTEEKVDADSEMTPESWRGTARLRLN